MGDYVPSTDEVRAQWRYNYPDYDNTDEQFDRWLAEHDKQIEEKFIDILVATHSHDPGICQEVTYYVNSGVESDECSYLRRIYDAMGRVEVIDL